MSEIKTHIKVDQIPATTGTYTCTTTGLGWTPKAVLVFSSGHTAHGTQRDEQSFMIGATDGTDQWVSANRSQDGVSTTVSKRRYYTDNVINIEDNAGGIHALANNAGAVANGWKFNFTTIRDGASHRPYFTVVFFGGADLQVASGNVTLSNSTTRSFTFGFESDLMFTAGIGAAESDTGIDANANVLHYGAAANNGAGGFNQFLHVCYDVPGQASSKCGQLIQSGAFSGQAHNDALTWRASLVGTTAAQDGAIIRTAGTPGQDITCYLAINTGDRRVWCGQLATPTASGTWHVSTIGFKPQIVNLALSPCTVTASVITATPALAFGVSNFNGTVEQSTSFSIEDAQATTDTSSYGNSIAIDYYEADGSTKLMSGNGATMVSDGFSLSVATAPATARVLFGWAIEEEASGVPKQYNHLRMMRGGS